jgi:thiol-disulfide isomerase/thioredoxin
VIALVLLLASGCAGEQSPGLMPGETNVDVDTPQLRALKKGAGIAPCPEATEPSNSAAGLPSVTLPCLGGGASVDLATLRGPLVLNLWASWCGPCRRELPIFADFATKHVGKIGVLGIDWNDTQPLAALKLARDSGVTYPLLADPQIDLAGIGDVPIRGLPVVVLIDADGQVAFHQAMEVKSLAELDRLVAQHLGTGR